MADEVAEPEDHSGVVVGQHRSAAAQKRTIVVAGFGVMWMLAIATFVNGPIDRVGPKGHPLGNAAPETLAFGDTSTAATSTLLSAGDVVFVNREPGDAWESVDILHPDGTRTQLDLRCERLHVAAAVGLCLGHGEPDADGTERYRSDVISFADQNLTVLRPDSGVSPSRARVSSDGAFASATMINQRGGDDEYADVDSLDTVVTMIDLKNRGSTRIDRFDRPPDADPTAWWSVTFAPDADTIWVTGADPAGPRIYQGSLRDRTLTPTDIEAACPSISPDGQTLVVRVASAIAEDSTDLMAIDLETDRRWMLNETREVNDQVEWLDDDTILYALPAADASDEHQTFDIWQLDLDAHAEPEIFLRHASSPSVIR